MLTMVITKTSGGDLSFDLINQTDLLNIHVTHKVFKLWTSRKLPKCKLEEPNRKIVFSNHQLLINNSIYSYFQIMVKLHLTQQSNNLKAYINVLNNFKTTNSSIGHMCQCDKYYLNMIKMFSIWLDLIYYKKQHK